MASRMDNIVTGPIPARGFSDATLHVRTRANGAKDGAGTCMFEGIDVEVFQSTSNLFRKLYARAFAAGHHNHVYIVWKDFHIVDCYVKWLHDRIVHRIPAEEVKSKRQYQHTVLKYPKHPLKEYSPLVQDMHTLINMWLFGFYVEDATFMDTIMSFLEELLQESHEPEYDDGDSTRETFFRLLKPSVIDAIWSHTTRGAKLRAFVVDYLLKYGTHIDILRFNGTIVEEAKVSAVESAPPTPVKSRKSRADSARPYRSIRQDTTPSQVSSSESSTDDSNTKVEDSPQTFPPEFITELNNAQRGSLLVSQLPIEIQSFYHDQVRVFLPPLPYSFEMTCIESYTEPCLSAYGEFNGLVVRKTQQLTSMYQLHTVAFRIAFFKAVYGEGQTVLRSTYWDTEGEVQAQPASGNHLSNTGGTSMSCVYHQHTKDGACWVLGKRFRQGVPVPVAPQPANV
ncbi:uncharacterized protein N0V89_006789 [Didymosphaeria variabile]|uniref:Uncharacterized protein n=1 Tax=Didymosphaeria variabile TaxID=1932322 RepID=A0A9W9C9V3_9PLEO|nr:uncharacterized protein N0V89_006789 [Didymosphaeria variabile]KAJ4351447.1 hypothetical protein N0V89_006789 [Didymosphaeria variabile]